MGKDEMGEWGEPFNEAEPPRRDRVPEPGFSRPSDVNANPELTSFIPPFRAKRRRVARRVTFVVVAAVGVIGLRLAWWTARVGVTDERRLGIVSYFFWLACLVAGIVTLRQVWKWAGAPDPADARRPH
jgi:hypothetical protein